MVQPKPDHPDRFLRAWHVDTWPHNFYQQLNQENLSEFEQGASN